MRVTVGFSDDTVGAELTGINKTDWVKPVDDDYYYYRRILHPGETTSAVFTSVTIPPLADKRLDGMEEDALKIDVYEEAVPRYNMPGHTSWIMKPHGISTHHSDRRPL